jgi:hypothetical protein
LNSQELWADLGLRVTTYLIPNKIYLSFSANKTWLLIFLFNHYLLYVIAVSMAMFLVNLDLIGKYS